MRTKTPAGKSAADSLLESVSNLPPLQLSGTLPGPEATAIAPQPPPAPRVLPLDGGPVPPLPPIESAIQTASGKPLFETANAGTGGVAPDIAKIVETVYAVHALRDYEELERNLEVGENRGDYRTLTEALDKAEGRARRAHALYLGAKLELTKYELDADEVRSAMHVKAVDALENEKAAGDRTKRITNDDVETKIRELFSDEVRSQRLAREKLKGTVEHLETLAKLWQTKCYSLSALLGNLRK